VGGPSPQRMRSSSSGRKLGTRPRTRSWCAAIRRLPSGPPTSSRATEKALEELRGLGKEVTTDTVRGEDVTEEFVDLESRERNLLAAVQSLLELYGRAQSVNDALAIERELANIRGQIEQVQGRIQYLEERAATSQIALGIQPVARPKAPPPAWNPGRVVEQPWNASLGVLQALATAVISAVVFGWWLSPMLVAGLVLWRRRHRGYTAATGSSQAP
jgi:uncharacterized protein DUF4349